jgi:IS605 OrfB family transposase
MIVTKTARRRLRNYTRYLDYTLDIYRNALEYVNNIVYAEWVNIEQLPLSKQRVNFVERLIHSTSKNKAIYEDFDRLFYKFPSYFRRAVIMEAIGNVSSHMTRYRQWEEYNRNRVAQGKKPRGKAPTFQAKCNAFPVFYRDGMSRWIRNGRVALKLYNGSDWIWFVLPFEPVDTARFEGWVRQNPLLVKKNNRWSLHIPFEKNIELQDKDFVRPILSIDLGLNHTATCSVVSANGTVLHREFIDYAREKDRLRRLPGQVADSARKTWLIPEGQEFARRYWRIVTALTDEIAHQCSHRLVEIARKHNCQAIVFEHLGKLKVPKNFKGARRLRKKLHYWLQGRIQRYTKYKAHAEGIRFSRVWANGTSRYAYDGSGEVVRVGNGQCAVFMTGKTYNADLSASYNIGARYWVREIQSLTGNSKVAVAGESPATVARHQQTLASLISLGRLHSMSANTDPVLYSGQGFSVKETATKAVA